MSKQIVEFPRGSRPTTDVNMGITVLLAIGLTALIFGLIWPLKGTFIRDLMIGRYTNDPGRYVFQGLTTFMWSLSTMCIVLKRFNMRREFAAVKDFPVPPDLEMGDVPALVELYERILQIPTCAKRIVYTRCARILAMWINTQDFERTTQGAKEDNELDVFLSDSSFRANRLFIWAMPLLGFVGTVYGVSYGIGGFAEFLRGEVTSEQIKYQVGLITEGLAVAFYTTLVGLWTAGAAAFPSLSAERKEEELLGDIDDLVQERLISRMPSARQFEFPVEHFTAMRDGIARMSDALAEPMKQMVENIAEGFRRLPSPQRYEDIFAQAIAKAADLINDKYSEFMIRYEIRVGELGDQLAGKLQVVADKFQGGSDQVAKEMATQSQSIRETGTRQVEQQAVAHREYLAAMGTASEREAARWKEAAADLQRQVGDAGQQLGQAVQALREASSLAARGADEAARGLATQMTRLVDVGSRIEQLLQATRAIEVALGDMATTQDFRMAMNELRQHLQSSDELVKRLSRPKTIVFSEAH